MNDYSTQKHNRTGLNFTFVYGILSCLLLITAIVYGWKSITGGYVWLVIEGEEKAMVLPLKAGNEFTISYLHSVNRTPVKEIFICEKINGQGKIILTATEFSNLGVGTVYQPGEGTICLKDNVFYVSGLEREVKELNYIVWPANNFCLTVNGHHIYLLPLAGNNRQVKIYTNPTVTWQLLTKLLPFTAHKGGQASDSQPQHSS